MVIKLPQKFLGRPLVEDCGVLGRGVAILTFCEDDGNNGLSPAAAGFLHANLVVGHFDSLFVCALGKMMVIDVVRKQEGGERGRKK